MATAHYSQDGSRHAYAPPRREDPINGAAYRARLIAEGRLKPDSPPVLVTVDQPTLRIGRIIFPDAELPRRRFEDER